MNVIRTTMSSTTKRYPIASLPLPPLAERLTHNLNPDPVTPSVAAYQNDVLRSTPSIQRRSRMVPSSAHYSFTSPLVVSFPYRIPRPENSDDRDAVLRNVENWLGEREPLKSSPTVAVAGGLEYPDAQKARLGSSLGANDSLAERHLLALSQSCVDDCLPALDIGDAAQLISGSLSASESESTEPSARQELVDVLSGASVIMQTPGGEGTGYAPWSLRYCGHQFGIWAGQLGDGRAVSILETPHPSQPDVTYEIQLKGAGRTPYSRHADGLAVLRSSIREFLGAEAMNALHIPTTRSLSLISLPLIPVTREKIEYAAITSRISPSFIRIGSFQAHDKPEDTVVYLMNPDATSGNADWEAMRKLGEWVSRRVLRLDGFSEGKPWALWLVKESARRNAIMVAGWQAYGFMHGVMNTDNISIAGLTLDYGPYAFMDIYDNGHICNHTDEEGRYAFKYQPTMIIYAIRALLKALAPLIGAERELGHAVGPGYATDVDETKVNEWKAEGMKAQEEIEGIVMDVFKKEYYGLMRKRLGLKREESSDTTLVQSLLELLQTYELDFHSTFRTLCHFRPSLVSSTASTDASAEELVYVWELTQNLSADRKGPATRAWQDWLRIYSARITLEESDWEKEGEKWAEVREERMKEVNPRFVLRQWVLEEVIAECEKGDLAKSRAILAKILEMSTHPFRPWGAEGKLDSELSEAEREERIWCELGERSMVGFQCSCSS